MKTRLDNLNSLIKTCEKCSLCQTRTNTVFGEGNPLSPIMIIGEAPGANEDTEGVPFVGKAGKFLDQCLEKCGLDRERVFIANIMKCRPCIIEGKTNKNRPPTTEETKICSPYLAEQIKIIQPKIILALGAPAAKFILDRKTVKMNEIRGHFAESIYCDFAMVSLHPSYILTYKGEAEKQMLISDIKACREKAQELGLSLEPGPIYTHKTDLFSF